MVVWLLVLCLCLSLSSRRRAAGVVVVELARRGGMGNWQRNPQRNRDGTKFACRGGRSPLRHRTYTTRLGARRREPVPVPDHGRVFGRLRLPNGTVFDNPVTAYRQLVQRGGLGGSTEDERRAAEGTRACLRREAIPRDRCPTGRHALYEMNEHEQPDPANQSIGAFDWKHASPTHHRRPCPSVHQPNVPGRAAGASGDPERGAPWLLVDRRMVSRGAHPVLCQGRTPHGVLAFTDGVALALLVQLQRRGLLQARHPSP